MGYIWGKEDICIGFIFGLFLLQWILSYNKFETDLLRASALPYIGNFGEIVDSVSFPLEREHSQLETKIYYLLENQKVTHTHTHPFIGVFYLSYFTVTSLWLIVLLSKQKECLRDFLCFCSIMEIYEIFLCIKYKIHVLA